MRPFDIDKTLSRAEIGNVDWHADLLELARLLDHLRPPDHRHPDLYFEQRSAITHELRRLARRAKHAGSK